MSREFEVPEGVASTRGGSVVLSEAVTWRVTRCPVVKEAPCAG